MTVISENTHALLLLTAPLIVGVANVSSTPVLSLSEFNKLARSLKEMAAAPADLLAPARTELLQKLSPLQSPDRIEALLDRGFQMSQAIEKWSARGIWITSREDADYPELLKTKLDERAPIVIYGCGDKSLLQNGGLAVVGSRGADAAALEFTQSVGQLAATAG
jgi:predicted Rossmann fold nucleotide-binding protein DprA/Smf involved in DNA uptake